MTDFNQYEIVEEDNIWTKLKNSPMSYYIVAINVLVFLAIHISNFLIADGWLVSKLMKITYNISIQGEYYRLVTAVFSHYEPMHLFSNCFAILILGRPVEQIFGKWKFLIIFLVAGLFGTLTSFIFTEAPALGASGGVFGIFGVHLYLFLINKSKYLSIFGKDMLQLLVINVVIGFALPNIDYWGHFGGILGGFLATASLGLYHQIKINRNLLIGSLLILLIFFGSFITVNQAYVNYVENEARVISKISAALESNNLERFIEARDEYDSIVPLVPPISIADEKLKQMDAIIDASK